MSRTIKLALSGVLAVLTCVLGFCTKITIPVFLVLIGLKVFYPPYTLGWAATVIIPLVGGFVCWGLCVTAAVAARFLVEEL